MGYKLYVFLRSDLESLNAGKAAAQTAHAASQAAWRYKNTFEYDDWANEPSAEFGENGGYVGFGTTIVLDAGSFEDSFDIFDNVFPNGFSATKCGIVKDPTYPIKDGKKTHYIDLVTCYWALENPNNNLFFKEYAKQFNLYNGNTL